MLMKLLDDLFHIQALDERYVTREINNRQITYKEYGMNAVGHTIMQGKKRDFHLDVFNIRRQKQAESKRAKPANEIKRETRSVNLLFEALRSCRSELAKQYRVRAYNVASDQMLQDLCAYQPTTKEELLEISGMGPHRVNKYGDELLQVVLQHAS